MQATHRFSHKGALLQILQKGGLRAKKIPFKIISNVIAPGCFIFTSIKKKKIVAIILALQMAQTLSPLKSKVEIVLDVSCINLAPRMAIMLHVHSLHLVRLIVEINKEEFKQNITINVVRMQ
jgi:hypothetical protein